MSRALGGALPHLHERHCFLRWHICRDLAPVPATGTYLQRMIRRRRAASTVRRAGPDFRWQTLCPRSEHDLLLPPTVHLHHGCGQRAVERVSQHVQADKGVGQRAGRTCSHGWRQGALTALNNGSCCAAACNRGRHFGQTRQQAVLPSMHAVRHNSESEQGPRLPPRRCLAPASPGAAAARRPPARRAGALVQET